MSFPLSRVINTSSLYVLINVSVSIVGFARSYLFMKCLDMSELGIISLVQTVVMFLGLFQLGLLNGGYRIFSLNEAGLQRDINNVLFTYFSILLSVALLFWITLVATGFMLVINNTLMLAALICGILSLMMNWLTNTLIGKRLIKSINAINFTASVLSLLVLPLVIVWGMQGAIVALLVQPLFFVTLTLWKHPDLRPTAWNLDLKLIRYILSFGFIPFLAGIFVIVNMQIERWSIADILGTAALGEFYLVFLYSTLFILVPTSLLNIFFPRAILAYENCEMLEFNRILKKHFCLVLLYLLFVSLLTTFTLQFFIDWILPQHSANTIYVYYFLPGLIALVLCDPFSMVFNATVRLKPMLYAGLLSILLNLLLIIFANYYHVFSLTAMAYIKTGINVIVFGYYVVYVVANFRLIFKKI